MNKNQVSSDPSKDEFMDPALLAPASELLKAMAHPMRLWICCLLCKNKKLNVQSIEKELLGTFEKPISQSQLSQFLLAMKKQGFIDSEKDGLFVYYFIKDANIEQIIKSLHLCFSASKPK